MLRFVFLAFFALSLSAVAAPTVAARVPAAGATVSALTSVSVTFSEAATGVDPNDLEINTEGALFVTGSGAGPYLFSFTQPLAGAVHVAFAGESGIAGQAGTGSFAGAVGITR